MTSTSRIAKNTLFLYFRQILIMLVSLYTVRVVLNVLGAEDYGIYNVVAGVVVLFSFVNNAMASSVQRYLTFFIGKNDAEKTQDVFSKSLVIHILICLILILLAETVGVWFLNTKLNIPAERSAAAFWCYQAAVITTLINIIRVPYNAVIIAYEKMSFFAWLGVIEAILKLAIVFLLIISPFDKLVAYSLLLTFVALVILAVYTLYCKRNFETAHYKKSSDKKLGKELISFSGWSLFGAAANVANNQGMNILLNLFTNVVVNAAMGIANQVNTAVYSFVGNFQTSFNPPLVKNYSSGNRNEFLKLLNRSSKWSFYLLWFITLPVFINCNYLLFLWLKNIPDYAISFVRLVLVLSLIDVFNNPLYTSINAFGNIKFYTLVISVFKFFPFLIVFILFKCGFPPEIVFYSQILCSFVVNTWRILYVNKKININLWNYLIDVILRCVLIVLITLPFSVFFHHFLCNTQSFSSLILSCLQTCSLNILVLYFIGFSKSERQYFIQLLKKKIRRQKNDL